MKSFEYFCEITLFWMVTLGMECPKEDLHVERIPRDVDLWKTVMLPELKSFYCNYIFPEMCEKHINGS